MKTILNYQRIDHFAYNIVYLFLLTWVILPTPTFSQNSPDCDQKIKQANAKFAEKSYQGVIDLLQPELAGDSLDHLVCKIQGYELLGQSLLQVDREDEAKQTIASICALLPQWSPEYPFLGEQLQQTFVNLAIKYREETGCGQKKKKEGGSGFFNTYIYTGIGTAVLGGVIYALTRNDDENQLPEPPNYPGVQ